VSGTIEWAAVESLLLAVELSGKSLNQWAEEVLDRAPG
jgi:predicted HicB family RNase H-like nuclease